MFKDIKVETSRIELKASDFSKEDLELLDIEGLSRSFVTIQFKEINDQVIFALRDFIRNQYKLPMKYIECVNFQYQSVKRKPIKDKSGKMLDYLYIEPLNNNYPSYIRYIPINQALPLDTSILINIDETKMPNLEPNYYFLRSNSMITDKNIEDIIKKSKPSSKYLKPWLNNVHIGSLDIDSKLLFKGKVSLNNPEVCNSLTLFGFNRDDDNKLFRIFVYDCYNVTPKEIFEMMSKANVCKECKEFCEAVVSKL